MNRRPDLILLLALAGVLIACGLAGLALVAAAVAGVR